MRAFETFRLCLSPKNCVIDKKKFQIVKSVHSPLQSKCKTLIIQHYKIYSIINCIKLQFNFNANTFLTLSLK